MIERDSRPETDAFFLCLYGFMKTVTCKREKNSGARSREPRVEWACSSREQLLYLIKLTIMKLRRLSRCRAAVLLNRGAVL